MEDLKGLHDQALQAAEQAKKAVESNAMLLQQKLAERTQLLSQLEQAKMQETVSASLRQMSELSAPGSTPSLGEVREKIERRYANALGQAELAQNSVEGRMLEVQKSDSGHGRRRPAGPDPGEHVRRAARRGATGAADPGGDRRPARRAGRRAGPAGGAGRAAARRPGIAVSSARAAAGRAGRLAGCDRPAGGASLPTRPGRPRVATWLAPGGWHGQGLS